jgi:hypothetical protein
VKSLRLNQARIDALVEQLYDFNKRLVGYESRREARHAAREGAQGAQDRQGAAVAVSAAGSFHPEVEPVLLLSAPCGKRLEQRRVPPHADMP